MQFQDVIVTPEISLALLITFLTQHDKNIILLSFYDSEQKIMLFYKTNKAKKNGNYFLISNIIVFSSRILEIQVIGTLYNVQSTHYTLHLQLYTNYNTICMLCMYYNSIYISGCVSCKFPDRAQSSAQYNIVCRDGEVV